MKCSRHRVFVSGVDVLKRSQLEHLIGAAATIASDDEIIVVGSQSILGQVPDAPADDRSRIRQFIHRACSC